MRTIFTLILLTLPAAGLAQERAASPMLVIQSGAELAKAAVAPSTTTQPASADALPGNFPKEAVTDLGTRILGQGGEVPATPPSPTPPAAPANAADAQTPANPNSPTPPPSPISKLWPRDTVKTFLPSCTGLHVEYIAPCSCVITKLMVAMPHDEFLKLSEAGKVEEDPRLQQIRMDCVTAPKKKD